MTARITWVPEGVEVDGALVRLTQTERALLAWLVAHAGEPQSASVLLREVWHYQPTIPSRTVVTTVSRLRGKLDRQAGHVRLIRTVPGGYLFEPGEIAAPLEVSGREAELAEIRRWRRAGGPILLVTGPPGIGKSALVEEALRQDAAEGLPLVPRSDLSESNVSAVHAMLDAAPDDALLWLDDADPVLASIGPRLAPRGRRLLITCRYPVDHPHAHHLRVGPLDPAAAHRVVDRWLASRFPGAAPSAPTRDRWVDASGGNPAHLRRTVWAEEGGGLPPGPTRHHTEAAAVRWGLTGLDADALAVLRRLAAAPPVDDPAAIALVGRSDARPILASLRARSLVDQVAGSWSVPAPVLAVVEADPAGLEPLLVHVRERFRQVEANESLAALRAWHHCDWALLTWAARATGDPAERYRMVQAADHYATWAGPSFDSRPILQDALSTLPDDDRWWILRRLGNAEIRAGMPPGDERVRRLFDASVAAADREGGIDAVLARRSRAQALLLSGAFAETIDAARELQARARAAGQPDGEADAKMLEAVAHLRSGRVGEAVRCVREAVAVHPAPDRPWDHALGRGIVLAEAGDLDEARAGWMRAIEGLRRAGRDGFAVRLEVEVGWTDLVRGIDPGAIRAVMTDHHAALASRLPTDAGAAALVLAEVELADDRPDDALRWLARARLHPERAAELRAVTAAAQVCAGIGLRADTLPEAPAGSDPRYEAWVRAFADLDDGRADAAQGALDPLSAEPGRTNAVLTRVLGRRLVTL